MLGNSIGTKPIRERYNCKNVDSVLIPAGSPVCLAVNGTEDGFGVSLPSTGGASKIPSLFIGVTAVDIAANDVGSVTVMGFIHNGLLALQTRPTSTDAYAAAAAVSVGNALQIDTINNAFNDMGPAAGSEYFPYCAAMQTLASKASSASTTSDSSVVKTYSLKMFVRAM